MSDLLKNPKICGSCEAPGCKLKCACKLVFYCGAECQGKHWPVHKKNCTVWLAKKIRDTRKEHGKDGEALGQARWDAGYQLYGQGRYREAERCYLDARRILSEAQGEGGDSMRITLSLGDMYCDTGRYEEALIEGRENLRISHNIKGERSLEAVNALGLIGKCLFHLGKHKEALAKVEEAHSIFKDLARKDYSDLDAILTVKGNCYNQLGRLDEARATFEEALRIVRVHCGEDSTQVAAALGNLGNIFYQMDMLDKARANYEEALGIMRRVRGERHPSVAAAFKSIGRVLSKQGQLDEALKMLSKALKIERRVLGEDHQEVARSLRFIGDLYRDQGKHDEALESLSESVRIYNKLGITGEPYQETVTRLALMRVLINARPKP
jgi:tetratricopeptide (TPR) repeat protein